MLGDIIVLLIIAAIILAAVAKIISDKRNGGTCSACPYSKTCSAKASCSGQDLSDLLVKNKDTQDLMNAQKGD